MKMIAHVVHQIKGSRPLTVMFAKSMSHAAIIYWCQVHRFYLTNIKDWSHLNWEGTGHYY